MRSKRVGAGAFLALAVVVSVGSSSRSQIGPPPAANSISIKGDNSTAGAVSFKGEFAGFAIACIDKSYIQVYFVTTDPKTGVRTETPVGKASEKPFNPEVASGDHTTAVAAAKGTVLRAVYTLDATGGNPTPPQAEMTASTADVTVK
jgi:hypothetical protein